MINLIPVCGVSVLAGMCLGKLNWSRDTLGMNTLYLLSLNASAFISKTKIKQALCDYEGVLMANYKECSPYPSGAA